MEKKTPSPRATRPWMLMTAVECCQASTMNLMATARKPSRPTAVMKTGRGRRTCTRLPEERYAVGRPVCGAKPVRLAQERGRTGPVLLPARMFEQCLDRRRTLQPCGYWEFSGAQEIRVEQLRLITCATVSKDSDDCAAWTEILGQAHCSRHVNAAGAAETEPLMLEQIEDIRHRLGVGNEIGLIDVDISDDGCNASKANAFARAVSSCIGNEGKPDAGIASGAFYHETARAEFAPLLRLQDHLPRRAVLHGLAGVHKFGFAENGAAGCFGGVPEFDQGRVADGVDDVFVYLHWESPVEHTHEAYPQLEETNKRLIRTSNCDTGRPAGRNLAVTRFGAEGVIPLNARSSETVVTRGVRARG